MEVIILCGGLGTRLRSVVSQVPKCMAPVAGKPFLAYMLAWLGRFPVTRVIFSVGYLREVIMDYVNAREWPFRVDYAVEETPLGTGGGIRLALSRCTEDRVLVVNGDTFFNANLSQLVFAAPVTVALKPMQHFDRYGAVDFDGSRITRFREKAPCREGLINGGIYAIDRTRLDLSSLPEKFSFEKEVLEKNAGRGWVAGQVSDSYFLDIGIPDDYARAQRELPELEAVLKASDAAVASSATTLFLDRDGVINRHIEGDYVRCWEQWEWMPGILESLALWARKFPRIVLVTNQRGVGRGLMSDADLADIHARMRARILEAGGRIDLILVCTEVEENHPRRKPNVGMFQEACALFPEITPRESITIGDADSDAAFAANCGMSFIRV